MAVSNFKFVSPGVFINEIDNSFRPTESDAIGPVVIGRSSRGLAMQPVRVESYSSFVEQYGDTVPGMGGGDIYRDGNFQSPMYGTYAARAFLRANVAPVNYIRLLGQQSSDATGEGIAGWQTTNNPGASSSVGGMMTENGGAYGLWVWPSGSSKTLGTGSLAAIWYLDQTASIKLSGALVGGDGGSGLYPEGGSVGGLYFAPAGVFTTVLSGAHQGERKISFDLDDSSANWIRRSFSTNPQLTSTPGAFYPSSSALNMWLGDTFEQQIRDDSLVGVDSIGVILPLARYESASVGPQDMRQASREAVAGWFVGQDTGLAADFNPESCIKLFRLKGRGHGEWLNKNAKVSIARLRESSTTTSPYGTFSVVIRDIDDTDSNVQVIERFDNCTLDPASPNFLPKKIGDKYQQWDATAGRLREYGDYENQSSFVYVEMNADVEAGATDAALLPVGYYGPPKFKNVGTSRYGGEPITGSYTDPALSSSYAYMASGAFGFTGDAFGAANCILSGATLAAVGYTGSLGFPVNRLRLSASDGGLTQTKAYFGFSTTRTATDLDPDQSVGDPQRLWLKGLPDDPTSYGDQQPTQLPGLEAWSYLFSMNDLCESSTGKWFYLSGSRAAGNASSITSMLSAEIDKFTAPFWGGFDGFNIKVPDPLYNNGMAVGTSNDDNSYIYHTWKRAVDTVSDAEYINMNLLTAPGLTNDDLTRHMITTCEDRADSLALIDLANVYVPPAEEYYAEKSSRLGTTPTQAATDLQARRIDSSYGCTFYPWVQTKDIPTGRMLWVPPSVAMMGVLASSEASSQIWFAPAGFNRGGLTDGAAGIPITSVTERLTSAERDTLYDSRINPIASFPSTGIVVFGQKTLQERPSALDRINVRRLVIYLKKQISILSTQVLFEQNVTSTWQRFIDLIDPFLANVKTDLGITDYRLILDETTTTDDLIDQNVLYAKIMVKPARAIEFIAIDFVIMSTGASFDD